MRRLRLLGFDPLTLRLTLGIMALVIVPLASGLYLLSRSHHRNKIEERQTAARRENRILEAALRHQMLDRDEFLMTEILRQVGAEPEVETAMVLDHDGVVRLSSDEQSVGTRFARSSPTCMVCHSKTPEVRERWVVLEEEEVLRSVLPIANRPECHECHDPGRAFNGILILDVSLAGMHRELRADAARMGGATAVLVIVLIGGFGLLNRQLVLVRLGRLGRTARAIADGGLEERVEVSGGDVIADLAEDFNDMADSNSELIRTIEERERQMAGVLNSLDDGLIVLDNDFRVVAANRSLSRRVCSYSESLQGQRCRDAVGHALPCEQDEECPTARCLRTGRLERAIYRQGERGTDGGTVHEVYASPVYAEDGSVQQVVEVWRDITERVREEEHLAEIERLSALGTLASGLSHQINTPLASTLTCAESILGRLEEPGRSEVGDEGLVAIGESARIIREQVLRCREITHQFLRFARGIPPSAELIELPRAIRQVVSLAEPTATAAGIRIEVRDDVETPPVAANTEVVQHVILNLLVNAIESIDRPGGTITVTFEIDDVVRVRIQDTGCGIPVEFQKNLFEPFRTRKPRGTGLGLFLSRQFMRRFGGDVRLLSSVVGEGSCIEVTFPARGRGRSS